jgi:hypothetical protein
LTASPTRRRVLLHLPLAALAVGRPVAQANTQDEGATALRRGGVVAAFRHADAPGTFDPPGFRLDDCSTQRNLAERGRAQSRRLGAWFAERQLVPTRVRSSPWCRCIDTATLAFNRADSWHALGSPSGVASGLREQRLGLLRQALAAARQDPRGFEVWVTHMFVLNDLVSVPLAQGEGLVLAADAGGLPTVLARLNPT